MTSPILFRPGTLWPETLARTRSALAAKALLPIATDSCRIDDAGIAFAVRKVSSLARKDDAGRHVTARPGPAADPFLPCEQQLQVAAVTPTHVALLNKFSVIEHHLLLVTRHFEAQETLLTADDFLAQAACLREIDGLAFYNGGEAAGASQAHKHLQLVPLPLAVGPAGVPVEPLFAALRGRTGPCTVPGLAFRHAFAWLDEGSLSDLPRAAGAHESAYRELLAAAGLHGLPAGAGQRQSGPYNLLATRRWMLLVPRSRECFATLSLNALAYAGALFVRNDAELALLRRAGPMTVLRELALPAQAQRS
ncbi:MAG: phosphorylase [Betaproteobacteria bacterium]|nr:phosphorylase [Betaproteobacteria bacterium]